MDNKTNDQMQHSEAEKALQQYLTGDRKGEDANAFEQMMEEDAFVEDAVEGLENLPDNVNSNDVVAQLNRELYLQMHERKERRPRRPLMEMRWTLIAVVAILLICILMYFYYFRT
jgi:ferric-dicitrate binding protein FerR (iron transport regulator)